MEKEKEKSREIKNINERKRSKILEMRDEGYTLTKISTTLEINLNTVKSVLYRDRHKDVRKPERTKVTFIEEKGKCPECGNEVPVIERRKPRRFCSDECRAKWWNEHPERVKRKAFYASSCMKCHRRFEAYGNNHRKYCSRTCYLADRFGSSK